MEFEIHNVAKVREAKIRLDSVAVIAGPNGSGKSTIAKGLMALRDTFRSLSHYAAHKRATDLLNTFFGFRAREAANAPGALPLPRSVHFMAIGLAPIEQPELLCSDTFWENAEDVSDFFAWNELRQQTSEPLPHPEALAAYDTLKTQILNWLHDPEHSAEAYQAFVVKTALVRAYCRQIDFLGAAAASVFVLREDDGSVVARVENGAMIPCENNVAVGSDTYYLEPRHILDEFTQRAEIWLSSGRPKARYGGDSAPTWADFAQTIRNADPTLEEFQRQEVRNALLGKMLATLNGQLTKQNRDLVFDDRSVAGQIQIPNVASGIKSMALIARAIENGWIREQDLLIIDEPESNLHPEWQIRFAEWLVDLSDKLGLRLLLNTHSPYFLRAVEHFCGRETMIGKLHVYLMKQDCDENGSRLPTFSAHDVTADIGQVYRTMAKPFEELE